MQHFVVDHPFDREAGYVRMVVRPGDGYQAHFSARRVASITLVRCRGGRGAPADERGQPAAETRSVERVEHLSEVVVDASRTGLDTLGVDSPCPGRRGGE